MELLKNLYNSLFRKKIVEKKIKLNLLINALSNNKTFVNKNILKTYISFLKIQLEYCEIELLKHKYGDENFNKYLKNINYIKSHIAFCKNELKDLKDKYSFGNFQINENFHKYYNVLQDIKEMEIKKLKTKI